MTLVSEAIARYHKLIESEPYIDLAWAHALQERIKSEKLDGRPVSPVLGGKEKSELLGIARETVEGFVKVGKAPAVKDNDPALSISRGAFVTLKKNGELRGCIGSFYSGGRLAETVREMAVEAASRDPRFRPVTKGELKEIKVEISVLSPLQIVTDFAEIEIGKHGLLIAQGGRRGLLLPQVASERGWDRETFLEALCDKANLPPGSWRRGATLQSFTAEIFNAHYGTRTHASAPAPAENAHS